MIHKHKWKDVPLEGKSGCLRMCSKCGMRSAKSWFVIVIPFIRFVDWSGTQGAIGHPFPGLWGPGAIIFLKKFRPFKIWRNIGVDHNLGYSSEKKALRDGRYTCGNCGHTGFCYGVPSSEGISTPFCGQCGKNNKLIPT